MPNLTSMRRPRSLVATSVAACAAALSLSAPALAADPVPAPADAPSRIVAETTWASVAECRSPDLTQPFTALGDKRSYVTAPGGDFSSAGAQGWQLYGGASVVADSHSGEALNLPAGSVAVSPAMCVDLDYPTARLWLRADDGHPKVTVGVAYAGTKTATRPHWVGGLDAKSAAWQLSHDFAVHPDLAGKKSGWREVAFVFVAGKDGDARIDDFFVDPRFTR
jgi:hypothetical protein